MLTALNSTVVTRTPSPSATSVVTNVARFSSQSIATNTVFNSIQIRNNDYLPETTTNNERFVFCGVAIGSGIGCLGGIGISLCHTTSCTTAIAAGAAGAAGVAGCAIIGMIAGFDCYQQDSVRNQQYDEADRSNVFDRAEEQASYLQSGRDAPPRYEDLRYSDLLARYEEVLPSYDEAMLQGSILNSSAYEEVEILAGVLPTYEEAMITSEVSPSEG